MEGVASNSPETLAAESSDGANSSAIPRDEVSHPTPLHPVVKPSTLAQPASQGLKPANGKRSKAADSSSPAKKRRSSKSQDSSPRTQTVPDDRPLDPSASSARQLENSDSNVPQRKQYKDGQPKMQPSTLDKLIVGIWENLYKRNDKTKLDVSSVSIQSSE